jgi:hypothetical protein
VIFYDLVYDGQAQSRSVALAAEERLKNLSPVAGRNTATVIGPDNKRMAGMVRELNADSPALFHSLQGIQQQV